MTAQQVFVIASWIGSVALWWLASGWLSMAGQVTFWLLLVSHPLEFIAKRKLFVRLGGSMGQHFVRTMIFGLFYWRPLEKQLEAGSTPS